MPGSDTRPTASWPLPPDDALEASAALTVLVRDEIDRAGGVIDFARYMELVLYAPGLGYYSGGARKFGPSGDFITAPEVSPLFGRCVARQVAEVLALIGGSEVLELGAGTGALAAAAIEELGRLGVRAGWHVLEPSPELRSRQEARLGAAVRWLEAPPSEFRGVILANEVADALPVERFRIRRGRVVRIGVGWDGDGFAWREAGAADRLEAAVQALQAQLGYRLPEDYESEVCLLLGPWVEALAASLATGLLLIVDYGMPASEYYAVTRNRGTLLCHYRHRAHPDPFLFPGLQDISAWVDFTAVARAGTGAGLVLEGFTPQSAFLAANGLDQLLAGAADDRERIRLAQQAKQLVLPGEMGERFRVMGLSRGVSPALSGFSLVDLAGRL